ncbi:MAG: hypothetical protein ACREKL_01560 [Chthoniobacterales bacterium]
MQKLLLVFVAAAGLAGVAFGKEFKLPDADNAYASVEIPDTWKAETYDKGVEAVSKDGEVYLAIETAGGDSLDKSIDDAMAYLKKQGVTVDDDKAETTEAKLGDMAVVRTNWPGKDEDGPCRVTLSIVAVSKGKGLLVIYWASPKGDEANSKDLDAIANSITPL